MSLILGAGLWIGVGIIGFLAIFLAIFLGLVPVSIWIKTMVSGAYIPSYKLIAMRLRNVDVGLIISCYINAKKAGVNISVSDLETHFMAGGNIEKVVDALIVAHGAKIKLSVDNAKAIPKVNNFFIYSLLIGIKLF